MISELASFALSFLGTMDKERADLLSLANGLKNSLKQNGFSITETTSHIVPLLLETEKEALFYANGLQEKGLDVRAIRPPTVPTPRLRISLNAKLKLNDIQTLVEELVRVREKWNSR